MIKNHRLFVEKLLWQPSIIAHNNGIPQNFCTNFLLFAFGHLPFKKQVKR